MEKLAQRENGGSPKTPESDDMDFKDVFGGPPRRFSMQDVRERYSFGESSSASSPWEKPVFGEEKMRQRGPDFFDDIFKGSPRRSDRDGAALGSNPGSRIMSPAKPFSPKPDALGSSLPAYFSLPAKLTKSMDLPTFGSHNHGQHKVDGWSIPQSWSPFSRFSNEASGRFDEVEPVSRQRPLSDEAEDSPISDQKDKDMSIGNDQFHFSIYKWAGGRGVPMLMPLVIGNNLKSKDGIKYDEMSARSKPESLRSETEHAQGDVRSRQDKKQEGDYVFEAFHESSDLKSKSSLNDSVVPDTSVKEEQVKSVDGSSVTDKIEKKVYVKISEGLDAFLDQSDQPEMKDKKARAQPVDGDSKKMKEKGRKGVNSNNAKVEKSTNLEAASEGKNGAAKGKVKEFVQIFNQDAAGSRPEADARGSQRWGNVGIDPKGSSNQAKVEEQVNLHNAVDKKPDVSFKEVENLNSNEAQRFSPKRMSTSTRSSSRLRKSFSAGALHEDLKISGEKLDDPLEDTFEVHELSDGNENVAHDKSSEETKAIDAKIRQWSVGKKGNIRSLLSTLQYVLWAESGWKPVPLVDLIESNSVKRAYQKALLRLHPDKLQQKGAAFHHKYIAEKVFDILQEAWDHFNTCSSLGI